MPVLGLGIETSCDETAVAVVRDGREALANVVYSQFKEHAPFLGVVPEIASRAHVEKINHVFASALLQAGVSAEQLDYVAVSARPGLVGSLMVGAQLARMIGLVHRIPVIACNHLEAHFHAVSLEGAPLEFPFLGLLLSGGNSAVFLVRDFGDLEKLADTRDDALGEAFDKTANLLALGYPGGPAIERAAAQVERVPEEERLFPKLLRNLPSDQPAFSFSGIKTAVMLAAQRGEPSARICNDFQETAFELVTRMLERCVARAGVSEIVACGGVLANGRLREVLLQQARSSGWVLRFPQARLLCTDNAGMVAALGHGYFLKGLVSPLDFPVSSTSTVR